MPNRNAIVMRRIENEHGWTLSRSAETKTRGRSHAPLLLKFHMNEDVSGVCYRMTMPMMATAMTINVVIVFFIAVME